MDMLPPIWRISLDKRGAIEERIYLLCNPDTNTCYKLRTTIQIGRYNEINPLEVELYVNPFTGRVPLLSPEEGIDVTNSPGDGGIVVYSFETFTGKKLTIRELRELNKEVVKLLPYLWKGGYEIYIHCGRGRYVPEIYGLSRCSTNGIDLSNILTFTTYPYEIHVNREGGVAFFFKK